MPRTRVKYEDRKNGKQNRGVLSGLLLRDYRMLKKFKKHSHQGWQSGSSGRAPA
jgi:hypothetical protein